MKVLVVDDDPSTQKIMKLLLEKSGYDPVIFGDGTKAFESAVGPDAPSLIVLDWMLPDMDGLSFCKKLRAANPKVRPYIIFLTSKREKGDAVTALDSGADDFVTKPFNVAEMHSRLRVGRRTLDYQRELQKQADAHASLGERTYLRGEISNKQREAEAPKAEAAVAATAVKRAAKPTDFSNQEIRFLLSATLMEMRLVLEAAKLRNGAEPLSLRSCEYCAWGALMLPGDHAWLDVMVAVKTSTLTALFGKALTRKANSEVEHRYFLAELARAIVMGFMRTLERRGGGVHHPLMSRTVKVDTRNMFPALPADSRSYDLVIEGEDVQLILAQHDCPLLELAPPSLRELDVLAQPFPSKALSEVPMFMEGMVLTPRFIEKLIYHVETSEIEEPVKVRRPSGMAQYFNYTE
jgi:DNA-binding response OmpR family regulator